MEISEQLFKNIIKVRIEDLNRQNTELVLKVAYLERKVESLNWENDVLAEKLLELIQCKSITA